MAGWNGRLPVTKRPERLQENRAVWRESQAPEARRKIPQRTTIRSERSDSQPVLRRAN
jgi:hypothetical protein